MMSAGTLIITSRKRPLFHQYCGEVQRHAPESNRKTGRHHDKYRGPVWSALYLMMPLAAWLVWRRGGLTAASIPISLFIVQLGLNVVWSIPFFGLHMAGLAFGEIVVLCFALLATPIAFWRSTPTAGYLLLPYFGWTVFATVLNLALCRMNA